MTSNYDAIIVGGGMAGLTAAAYLSCKKKKILLIEKNNECGGLVNTFSRDGFRFEAGVRALVNAGIILPMLDELDIDIEFVKSPVSVGIEDKILHVKDAGSLVDYRNLLVHFYPENEDEIDEVIKRIRKIMKEMDVLYGVENPIFKEPSKDLPYLFKKLLPWLPKFFLTTRKISRMNMPVEEYLEGFVHNPSLRDIISQHFFKNTHTFFAMSYFSLYLDYFYPKGGVGKLAEALEKKILACGGEIKKGTMIKKVIAGKNLVIDENDVSYVFRHLVWAADMKTLYRITGTDELPSKVREKIAENKIRLMKFRGGDSVFTLYLEVDEPLEQFREIGHGHFFYSPSRSGLGKTHTDELEELVESHESGWKEKVMLWLDKFTGLNTYEISIPGLKDPDMVPPGKTGLIISLMTEYDLFRRVSDEGWYEEFISELEYRIIDVLAASVYPMLKEKVIKKFSFSPLSIEKRVGTSEGAITGWSFQGPVPAVHSIPKAPKAVKTPIPNVFQAGQWTYSPAGVPMSILTGRLAADKVMKKKT